MAKINTNSAKIQELLERGVDEAIDKKSLEKKLKSGKVLRIKLGIDPTSPNIHLGRSIPLLKLKDFQELGHQVVFIVGDFTGVIGDTSDKDSERPMLTGEIIKKNMKDYAKQAGKIIDLKKCEVHYNSEWLSKLTNDKLGKLADQFSLAEFIARENIKKRLDAGKRVSLRELLYPLMQGYDSVMVKADVELGGTDQRFNLLAGRKLQEHFKQQPQDIIMTVLMEGTDGRKMSSSWGNTINLTDEPNDMFGKVMSINDDLIIKYFTLATRISMAEVKDYEKQLKSGTNPMEIKDQLAFEIVKFYHGEKFAIIARDFFSKKFRQKKNVLSGVQRFSYDNINETLVEFLERKKIIGGFNSLIASRTKFRQLVEQGGVRINDVKILSPFRTLQSLRSEYGGVFVLSVGKLKDSYIIDLVNNDTYVNIRTLEINKIDNKFKNDTLNFFKKEGNNKKNDKKNSISINKHNSKIFKIN